MRWPAQVSNGKRIASQVRALTVADIHALSQKAADTPGVSAVGRPGWLAQHGDDVQQATLQVFGPDVVPGVQRCIVTLLMKEGDPCFFTLDVADDDLRNYRALTRRQLIELTHLLLAHAKHVPLDPAQEARSNAPTCGRQP